MMILAVMYKGVISKLIVNIFLLTRIENFALSRWFTFLILEKDGNTYGENRCSPISKHKRLH